MQVATALCGEPRSTWINFAPFSLAFMGQRTPPVALPCWSPYSQAAVCSRLRDTASLPRPAVSRPELELSYPAWVLDVDDPRPRQNFWQTWLTRCRASRRRARTPGYFTFLPFGISMTFVALLITGDAVIAIEFDDFRRSAGLR